MSPRRGPDLPYSVVAGVTSLGPRWLVASAKMAAATFAPEEPRIFQTFDEVLTERPSFSAIVVNAPIGYLSSPGSQARRCDVEARALLGRRAITVHNAPTRATLSGELPWNESHLDAVTLTLLSHYIEIANAISSFRQRTVYSSNPELSFYLLNDLTPLGWSKKTSEGLSERRTLLVKKIPGVNRIIDSDLAGAPEDHLLDASALLWTARRVSNRAATRIPSEAEWDSEGLRMEMVF